MCVCVCVVVVVVVGGSMLPCSLKIIDRGSLFPKTDYLIFHVPFSPKLVLFPCSLKYLPMFSESKWVCSLVSQNPWEGLFTEAWS